MVHLDFHPVLSMFTRGVGCYESMFPLSTWRCAGTKREKYLEENLAASDVKLTRQDMDRLEAVFHGKVGPDSASAAGPAGMRAFCLHTQNDRCCNIN